MQVHKITITKYLGHTKIDESHIIVDISTPQNQEEQEKVTKSKVVTALEVGAIFAITDVILNALMLGNNVALGHALETIINSIGLLESFCASGYLVSTINKYKQSNLGSSYSNDESEAKKR